MWSLKGPFYSISWWISVSGLLLSAAKGLQVLCHSGLSASSGPASSILWKTRLVDVFFYPSLTCLLYYYHSYIVSWSKLGLERPFLFVWQNKKTFNNVITFLLAFFSPLNCKVTFWPRTLIFGTVYNRPTDNMWVTLWSRLLRRFRVICPDGQTLLSGKREIGNSYGKNSECKMFNFLQGKFVISNLYHLKTLCGRKFDITLFMCTPPPFLEKPHRAIDKVCFLVWYALFCMFRRNF